MLIISACQSEKTIQPVYTDIPFLQDYAVKFTSNAPGFAGKKVYTDRNGVIQVLAADGLYCPDNGRFQYPGTLQRDLRYRPMADKRVTDMTIYKNQFIYVDDKAVFSNAWAGNLFSRHNLADAKWLCAGTDFSFMISNGTVLTLLKDSDVLWTHTLSNEAVLDIKFDTSKNRFLVLTPVNLYAIETQGMLFKPLFQGSKFTCFETVKGGTGIVIGTSDGYLQLDASGKQAGDIQQKLPWTELTAVKEIDGNLWFGSSKGAFMQREDGRFNYYLGQRWLPADVVVRIAAGPNQSVLILTDQGLGQICFEKMTLADKAMIYEKQVRERHIRYGINSNLTRLKNHDLSSAENSMADSDNLWTASTWAVRYSATALPDLSKRNRIIPKRLKPWSACMI